MEAFARGGGGGEVKFRMPENNVQWLTPSNIFKKRGEGGVR